jgi:hypothetical protein
MTFIGHEASLLLGIVDAFHAAAQPEGSMACSNCHQIPTTAWVTGGYSSS